MTLLRLSPNPARDFSQIHFSALSQDAWIEIVDEAGRILRSYSNLSRSGVVTFERDGLPDGIYFVRLRGLRTLASQSLLLQR